MASTALLLAVTLGRKSISHTRCPLSCCQRHPSSLMLLFLPFTLLGEVQAICWFPDGVTQAVGDEPCHSSGNSTCCGQGFACLSNRLCMLTSYDTEAGSGQSTYVRGSCTDHTWTDPNCPQFCVSPSHNDNSQGAEGVAKCPSVGNQDMYYCLDNITADVNCASTSNVLLFSGEEACRHMENEAH